LHHPSELRWDPLSRTQREGLRPSHSNARHGGPQIGRIFAYEEALRVQTNEEQVGAAVVPLVPPLRVRYSLERLSFLAVRRRSSEPHLKLGLSHENPGLHEVNMDRAWHCHVMALF